MGVPVLSLTLQKTDDVSGGNENIIGGNRLKDMKEYPSSKFETKVRNLFETIIGKKFPTVYPDWLRENGKELELDGYNEELGIAFEVQGPQHTKFDKRYDTDVHTYIRRIKRDKFKVDKSEEHDVELMVIDYALPRNKLYQYIKSRLYDITVYNPKHKSTDYIKTRLEEPHVIQQLYLTKYVPMPQTDGIVAKHLHNL